MPNPTTKSRQELRSRFVRNAIPTEADFADLIGASLNLADDGLRKLPNEPLGLVRQKADQPLLRFFADPTAEGSVWQMSLSGLQGAGGLGFTNQSGMSVMQLEATGNVGIGTTLPEHKLTVEATNTHGAKASYSRLASKGALAIKGNAPQLDFLDTSNGGSDRDWAIHANDGRLYFIHSPWEYSNLVIDASSETAKVGIGTHFPKGKLHLLEAKGTLASAKEGTLVIEHADSGGYSSMVFQSTVARDTDFAYMEYRDKNPNLSNTEAGLLTIGIQNDADDHLALMPSGNVGINTTTPGYRLHVNGTAGVSGQVDLVTGSNPIRFSGAYSSFSDNALNTVEICNDTVQQKRLIIAGNKSAGGSASSRRVVGIYDDLIVNGIVVRKVWAATGASNHDIDSGKLSDRILKVTKLLGAESALRITYYDNFRVWGDLVGTRWEIRVNGNALNPPINMDRYEASGNRHISGTLVGYAQNLPAGTHEIQVWIGSIPSAPGITGYCNAFTGYFDQTWTLEAEEVRLNN
jgi:hypothetical protein